MGLWHCKDNKRRRFPQWFAIEKNAAERAKGKRRKAKDESITQHQYRRQPFANRATLVLSHPCRTSPTMHRQRLDNASPCLSDPCGTNAALPLPRPSRTTKQSAHRLAAPVGMNANGITPPSVIPQPSVEDSAARKSLNKFVHSLPSSYLCRDIIT